MAALTLMPFQRQGIFDLAKRVQHGLAVCGEAFADDGGRAIDFGSALPPIEQGSDELAKDRGDPLAEQPLRAFRGGGHRAGEVDARILGADGRGQVLVGGRKFEVLASNIGPAVEQFCGEARVR